MKEILYFSRSAAGDRQDGGGRRQAQILEILKDLDCRLFSFSQVGQSGWAERECAEPSLALMDDPIDCRPLFNRLIQLKTPVVAVCGGLRGLTLKWEEKGSLPDLLFSELEILKKCSLVITISREEAVLLRNLGLRTRFLPYYPSGTALNRLKAIREKRVDSPKEGILPLDSDIEPLLCFWKESRMEASLGKLLLEANPQEDDRLVEGFKNSVEFLGPLSEVEFDQLLGKVKACIFFQERGSGALTRICDMLVAGVPVLANSHSARSYYHKEGVLEFRDWKDLEKLSKESGRLGKPVPFPVAPDSRRLLNDIISLAR